MRGAITYIGYGLLAAAALFLLDRLFLFFEKKGWIYYRKTKGFSTSLGTSALEIQSILEPDKKRVVEERREERKEEKEAGEGEK